MSKVDLSNFTILKDIREKLNEYGINVKDEYKINKADEYVFVTTEFSIFTKYKEDTIGILFPITVLPHVSANYTLLINEIKSIKKIYIIESFVLDDENKILTGKEAFEYTVNKIASRLVKKSNKEEIHEELFKNMNWDLCPKC